MAVPMISSAKGVTFGGFQRRVASFRVAGMALRDIPTCVGPCRKSFCVAGALLLYTFVLFSAFFVAGAALWSPPSFRVAGAALQTCRVACFCESHCQGCVKWRQGANSVVGVSFCEI
jgi:hypothetical protein